ncbi:ATP-dependent RNA helicase dbp6 [Dispira simplex]|nr:ATP-dependent RNA helicase dbp6 [Dispira simplex]
MPPNGIPQWLVQPEIIPSTAQVSVDSDTIPLSLKTRDKCRKAGITEFFAVQAAVIPRLLHMARNVTTRHKLPDLCVSAPTGSGKTLAYVLPLIEKLQTRVVTRLRAVVLVPTRDLAVQVKGTFDQYTGDSGLQVGLATGQHTFAQEQKMLCNMDGPLLVGGASVVDILVCTPGRLVDHLANTRNFTLQHLEFLVIDEADRLLHQNYSDWLPRVLEAVEVNASKPRSTFTQDRWGLPVPDADSLRTPQGGQWAFTRPTPRMQKLLFSATLTTDPAQLASLKLVNPECISVRDQKSTQHKPGDSHADNQLYQETYSTPDTLTERIMYLSTEEKPIALWHLMQQKPNQAVVCFTHSVESAHRLYQLMEFCNQIVLADESASPVPVAEYSSDLTDNHRRRLLDQFKAGEIRLLIASDVMARGIHVDCIDMVINYDAPLQMQSYIHRVGRTARAGRQGTAYTLVESAVTRQFNGMLKRTKHFAKIKRYWLPTWASTQFGPIYEQALERMKQVYVGQ